MNTKHHWVDWVRNGSLIHSIANTTEYIMQPIFDDSFKFSIPTRLTNFNRVNIPAASRGILDDQPCYLFFTNAVAHGYDKPHMSEPAAAQTISHLTIVWVRDYASRSTTEKHVNRSMGGEVTLNYTRNDKEYIIPHRDDGKPAIMTFKNVNKWYTNGKLHRKGNQPAIKADTISALWFQEGEQFRPDGPSAITLDGYQEFHKDGIYKGYKCADIYEHWDKDPIDCTGPRYPMNNTYFGDPQDAMGYIAQNA